MTAIVHDSKFRRSSLPQRSRKSGDATPQIFSKMKELVTEYYMDPENIPTEITDWEENEEDSSFCL